MRKKKPHVAMLSEVTITRQGDSATIEFKDPEIAATQLRIGRSVWHMTGEQILGLFNETLVAAAEAAGRQPYVAVEIPPGRSQIEYDEGSEQWVPRGGVLRCLLDDYGGEVRVTIDDQELSQRDFGRMLTTYSGWGMRIVFVPEDEIEAAPTVEIRESEEPGWS